ncbi:sugar phosphate transferase [Pyrobaculum aerophilum]|uniref:Sugar phospate transferase n=2 Tax=Pyrobaculum aerophilum TaxID=13773 RepID=Q8ZVB9_PYRAE|nr:MULTISPECIES: sugar phosphate transferase [Pyrobaculum]AAL64137.1 sugar phospate transferase [Pyrobaculum aerophilum str. IM2]MCX8137039.1 sugar phosphate transferase [Pyrobaculum aerophilum]HII47099.1 sugar phosphate transferase [Pyrobaculum aerophilum]
MEIALTGSIKPPLATPAPYLIIGGFRLVEVVALSLCDYGKVTIYVDKRVDLPTSLEGCRFEIREGVPQDVPKLDVGCAPYLLKSKNLACGGVKFDLGGEMYVAEPLNSLADVLEKNVEFMKLALNRIKALGIELMKGDVRGEVRGDVYIRGKVYEYAYLEGPAVVGPQSSVLPFTYIRPGTVLYYDSKVRDEAKNALLDAYTRKQHGGYLGDTYIAPFVNFGAGTTVSNLKNTLGAIRPSYSSKSYKKLGPVVGEFVKTAIGTLIYGGKYIGPLSHLYGVVDRDVPPLSIYKGGEIIPMDRDKAVEYLRRDLEQYGRGDLFPFYYKALFEKSLF